MQPGFSGGRGGRSASRQQDQAGTEQGWGVLCWMENVGKKTQLGFLRKTIIGFFSWAPVLYSSVSSIRTTSCYL